MIQASCHGERKLEPNVSTYSDYIETCCAERKLEPFMECFWDLGNKKRS